MSTNTRIVDATPERVWDVLGDGWLYPLFVVGASRMRAVDRGWPQVGAMLHHSVGTWPLLIDDTTQVLEVQPVSLLKLRARGWPLGEADVTFHLMPHGAGTEIQIEEDAVSGPGKLMPRPLRQPPLTWRNAETLRRLCYVVERRS